MAEIDHGQIEAATDERRRTGGNLASITVELFVRPTDLTGVI